MKKTLTMFFAVITAVVFTTSCKNEMKKELTKEQEEQSSYENLKVVTLTSAEYIPFARCNGAVTGAITDSGRSYFGANHDTSYYERTFFVSSGNKNICIPKVAVFVPGLNDPFLPGPNTSAFGLSYSVRHNLYGHWVDGVSSGGNLVPGAVSGTIQRMDNNSIQRFTGFEILPGRTAFFKFVGKIQEVSADLGAVKDYYDMALSGLPVMLKSGATSTQWTWLPFGTMPNNTTWPTPVPGHSGE